MVVEMLVAPVVETVASRWAVEASAVAAMVGEATVGAERVAGAKAAVGWAGAAWVEGQAEASRVA